MSLVRRTATVVAAVVFGAMLTAGAAQAATSETVCGNTSTPTGWVEVKYWDSSQCGGTGALYNTKRITDTSGVAAGGTTYACTYSPVPAGFYVTKYSTISDCNRGRGTSDYHNKTDLVRLTGVASGTTKTICGLLTVPSGWTVVTRYTSLDCQSYRGGMPPTNNTMTIRKS